MKNIFNFKKQVLFFALLSWVIPFGLSMVMVNPVSKEYLPNFTVFKSVMFILLLILTYFFYKRLKRESLLDMSSVHTFLLSNILLDGLVLLLMINLPFFLWVTTVFPVYLIVFYGMYYGKKYI